MADNTRRQRIFILPDQISLAKKRIASEPWAKDIVKRLRQSADGLSSEPLPVFEEDWWIEASAKHWSEIYPQINHHTNFAVAGAAGKSADAALVWALTGDGRYLKFAQDVLCHYADYRFFAKHPDIGLNWSTWCIRLLQAYELVYDTFDESDASKIDDFFRRALDGILDNDRWWIAENPGGLYNNHFAWHKLWAAACGLCFGMPEYVDYAIESDQGIRDLIVFGTRDDGLWFEGSINYQFTAVVPLAILARMLRNSGSELDLWTHRFANGRCLQDLLVGPLGTLFPDGTIPTIGDCYGYRLTLNAADLYYDAFDAYKRPDIGWLMSKRENLPASALFVENLPVAAEVPKVGTRLWPEHGYVMLRSQTGADYWKGEGFSAFLSYDRDTIHSQSDKLSMMVFGRGAHLAVDPEALATARHAFSSDVQKELNRSMICHNTIVVDQKGPHSATQPVDLLEFSQSADIALTTVGDLQGKLTPGVRLMRTVAATRDYVVDIFQAASEEPHTYEYLFHLPSSSGDFEPVDGFQPFEMPTETPWKWLKNARSKGVEDDWQVDAKQGDLTTRLNICAASGTRAIVCQFPHKDDFTGVPIPMVIARRTAKSAVFVSVLQAERGPFPELSVTVQPTRHGHLQVTVNRNNQKREFVVEAL